MRKLLLVGFMVLVGCETMLPHYSLNDRAVYHQAGLAEMAIMCEKWKLVDPVQARALYNSTHELFAVAVVSKSSVEQGIKYAREVTNANACPPLSAQLDQRIGEIRRHVDNAYAARATPVVVPQQQTVIYTAPQVPLPDGEVTFGLEEEGGNAALINTPNGQVLCTSTGPLINCR